MTECEYDWDRARMRDLMRKPLTAIDALRKANGKGQIGYAHGGDHGDWPAIQECLDKGWIEYGYDMSIGGRQDPTGRPYQRRDIFFLTKAGRQKLELHPR